MAPDRSASPASWLFGTTGKPKKQGRNFQVETWFNFHYWVRRGLASPGRRKDEEGGRGVAPVMGDSSCVRSPPLVHRHLRDQRARPCRLRPRRLRAGRSGRQQRRRGRSEEHTSELQSLMRISYAVFCLKKTNNNTK